jgi:hypothetical protein
MIRQVWLAAIALALFVVAGVGGAQAQVQVPTTHEGMLAAWVGKYDFNYNDKPAAEFGAQYRAPLDLWIFQPMVGLMHTTNGATNVFAGVSTDVIFFDRAVFTPGAAISGYSRGSGKDLGDGFEFRLSGEFSYRFDDNSRLGLLVYHLSNADLGRINPGEESIALIYSLPTAKIGRWFGN